MNNNFAKLVTNYFQKYIIGLRNLSKNTIQSYRDVFSLLMVFIQNETKIKIENLQIQQFNRDLIVEFLFYLEKTRQYKCSAINQRLAVIKSFFRYIQIECPDEMSLCQNILNIEYKKTEKPVIEYLNVNELEILLKQPDATTIKGRRDLTLLQVLYDTAARVQELCNLKVGDLRLTSQPMVVLHGKGNKTRLVPITKSTCELLIQYINENKLHIQSDNSSYLFTNPRKDRLSRVGVAHIISKYITKANLNNSNKLPKITPHCLRHSKAMHMVEAGINLIYIRDFLGHESIETTEIYAKANPEAKRKAIEKMNDVIKTPTLPDWNDNPDIVSFLKSL